MTVQVGDQLLNGQVIVAEVSGDRIVKIRFPFIKDAANNEMVITYSPAQTVADIKVLAQAVIDLLG